MKVLMLIDSFTVGGAQRQFTTEYSEESTPPVPGESTPVIDSYFAHFVPLVFQS